MSRRSRCLPLVALVAVMAGSFVGCSTAGEASFDPTGPCSVDGRRAGAYPDLEARIPRALDGAPPARLDSGRNCSPSRLGTLASHGLEEVRFAGGLWETDSRSGVTIAVFEAPGLTVERLAEFYETGARGARKTESITTSPFRLGTAQGHRLDTLNDVSFQSILVLPAAEPEQVLAVLVASNVREAESRADHDALVERASEAALAG